MPPERPSTPEVEPEEVVSDFHRLFYMNHLRTWENTSWLGRNVYKCPLDLWVYQEILFETRPDVIVEAGTAAGGSAFFFATLLDMLGGGRLITIDVEEIRGRPEHARITYLSGSSTAPDVVEQVRSAIEPGEEVMVVLDSDHSMAHVLEELRTYGPLVGVGQYLVVEDTNINGHPVVPGWGPGPMEAAEAFLGDEAGRGFEVDRSRERFFLTHNPSGYLRRVA